MKTFHELQEGLYDPNIFKAFFLAGGPGSGKSYVATKATGGTGLKTVNSDDAFETMPQIKFVTTLLREAHITSLWPTPE